MGDVAADVVEMVRTAWDLIVFVVLAYGDQFLIGAAVTALVTVVTTWWKARSRRATMPERDDDRYVAMISMR